MTDLDEEAKRIAASHPWASAGATETRRTDWQPQRAVPRRPAAPKVHAIDIEARVAADLAAIDRELDPQASRVFGDLLTRPWPGVQDWFAANWQDAYATVDLGVIDNAAARRAMAKMARLTFSYLTGAPPFRLDDDEVDRYRTPKQRTPKTYVAPGRKAGKTWIARLEQSKQARKR